MIAILNADMFGAASEPGEYVDWLEPDVRSEEEWSWILGCSVEEYAAAAPHMIVWDTRCEACLDHPGWAHDDLSRRSEPRDVCRDCYGSGVTQ